MSDMEYKSEYVAIIGMTGRFPGAQSLEAFWKNLVEGVEAVRSLSNADLLQAGVSEDVIGQPGYVPSAASLENFDKFDAEFFGFTPRQAECMDPQHRLFLECAWEAMERSGYVPGAGEERVGVFAGCGLNGYLLSQLVGNESVKSDDAFQIAISNDKDFLPTRVSYQLNLKGPSVNINTACSTSLTAVHFAVQSLLSFQSDLALAGGVTLQVPHGQGYQYEEGGILSPDGHCSPFDEKANGTIPGSGVGVVFLKRLSEAVRDNDQIHAVIRGGAINNDGSEKAGFTAPGIIGQTEVIAEAQALAEVNPSTISFVEAHGTGTILGDPIEVAALTKAFRLHTNNNSFCALGSLKGNMGHLDAASGVAGLIKAALAVEHGLIPASLHFTSGNPQFDLAKTPFYVNAKTMPWPQSASPRRAGVSSFGIGGTNVHLILEEAPVRKPSGPSRPNQIICLSARTLPALKESIQFLGSYLQSHSAIVLADVAYTLSLGRKAFEHRCAIIADSTISAISKLSTSPIVGPESKGKADIVFCFAEDCDWIGEGRFLYDTEKIFRESVDKALGSIKTLPNAPAHLNLASDEPGHKVLLTFLFQHGLAKMWQGWGISPSVLVGSGVGETTALVHAGIVDEREALRCLLEGNSCNTKSMAKKDHMPVLLLDTQSWVEHGNAEILQDTGSKLVSSGNAIFLEIGHGTLISRLRATLILHPQKFIQSLQFNEVEKTWSLAHALSKLWEGGAVVSWKRYFGDENRTKVLLPTYPFQRKKFWIEKTPVTSNSKSVSIFSVPSWKRERLSPGESANLHDECFLLFMDESKVAISILGALENSIQVVNGPGFQKSSARCYHIDPDQREHYSLLFEDLKGNGPLPVRIIHLLELSDGSNMSPSARSFYRLLYLIQALGGCPLEFKFEVFVVSTGVHQVLGNEMLYPERSLLMGPVRVATQEYPNISVVNIDIERSSDDSLVEFILREASRKIVQPIVALRGKQRWVPCFDNWFPRRESTQAFRERGVYLITGGLGGVGLELAEYLGRKYQARLILLGRRAVEHYKSDNDNPSNSNLQALTDYAASFPKLSQPKSLSEVPMLVETLNEFCSASILRFFEEAGTPLVPGVSLQIALLKSKIGIKPVFDKFFAFLLTVLENDGLISVTVNSILPAETVRLVPGKNDILKRAAQNYAEYFGIFGLIDHCTSNYLEVFSGKVTPISVLYPDGNTHLIEASEAASAPHGYELYHSRFLKELLLEATRRKSSGKLRVLEIGGGNGNLTEVLLSALGANVEYHFTDLGKTFLIRAEKKAADLGLTGMRFSQFDISKDPAAQGLETGSYDFIFGLNVVHATSSVRETLRNLKSLLAPKGILGLMETTTIDPANDMVWGLAEGWWLFDDYDLRSHGPLMPVDKWKIAFSDAGYDEVHTFPNSSADLDRADCTLFLTTAQAETVSIETSMMHFRNGVPLVENIEARLSRIRKSGGEVIAVTADVGVESQLSHAIDLGEKKFGKIHGVIHAALDLRGSTIDQKLERDAELEFAPKVAGSINLDRLFRNKNLDFLVFFSSHIGITGGVGTVGYCAASSFQDALAQKASQEGRSNVRSINWDRWRGVGNVVAAYEKWYKERTGHQLSEGLTCAEAIAALETCLAESDLPQVIVSAEDFEKSRKEMHRYQLAGVEHSLKPVSLQDRPSLSTPFIAAANETQKQVLNIWSGVLGIQKIGIKDDFSELGGDSLIAIQVISRLREVFQLELTVRYLYERPTIETLAEGIDNLKWSSRAGSESVDSAEEEVGVL